jgi:endonuclease YncB( thermonuclease family)
MRARTTHLLVVAHRLAAYATLGITMPRRSSIEINLLLLAFVFVAGFFLGRYSASTTSTPSDERASPTVPSANSPDDTPVPAPAGSDRQGRLATVEYVLDGDSLEVNLDGHRQQVRLLGIDAPEKDQPFADSARHYLQSLCEGRQVRLIDHGRDKYERILAEVFVGDICLNQQLVRDGYAWCYDRENRPMFNLEQQARAARRGLWDDPHPIRPGDWRRLNEP